MSRAKRAVVDCFVYHDWASQDEIVPYIAQGWREAFALNVKLPSTLRLDVANPYRSPNGDVLPGSSASGYPGPIGVTELQAAATKRDVQAAVLTCGTGKHIGADTNPHLSVALCAAINDWTCDRWLSGSDDRLWGSILVPAQLPDKAADEIRRVGRNPRMVQVQLSGNGLSKPFGHPLYHPIYRAAAELDLPVAIYADSDAPADTLSFSASLGPPATFTEFKILSAQALMTHSMSLIAEGVFEEWPRLKVLLVGGGLGWIPWTLWRADTQFNAWGRTSPWIRRPPSDYFREHFRVATYQMELNDAKFVHAVLNSTEGFQDLLCYGSGYPAQDSHDAAALEQVIPESYVAKVMYENAMHLYGSRIRLQALRT